MSQELRKALEIARSWMLYSHDGDADDYNEQTWNKYKEDCNIVVTALAAAPVDERGMRECPHDLAEKETACADGACPICPTPAVPKEEAERAVIEAAKRLRLTSTEEGCGNSDINILRRAVDALAALSGKDGKS